MLSPTLEEGLRSYHIGPQVRALRLKKKMGLVELGKHTGLSPAMLSKIECGRLFPTLPTLLRIALVFSVGLDFFFAGPRKRPAATVVRHGERLRFPEVPGGKDITYHFEPLDFGADERRLNAYFAEFLPPPANGRMRTHTHSGGEFIYVLSGTLVIRLEEFEHVLDADDSMYFDPGVPHSYHRSGAKKCTAVVVTTV